MTCGLKAIVIVAALISTSPALSQSMQGMDMGNMKMPAPAKKPATTPKRRVTKTTTAKVAAPRARAKNSRVPPTAELSRADVPPGMDHGAMGAMGGTIPGDSKSTPGMAAPSEGKTMSPMTMPAKVAGMALSGTNLPAGDAPAPQPPADFYAARLYPAADIERSHRHMMNESGAQKLGFVMFNLAEYQPRRDSDGFRWDGEGWYGGDINRVTLKTEGDGNFRGGVETAEVQAVYSRAIDPYFNVQAGVRQDLGKRARQTYATIGFEGLAPYMFEVEGALFLSTKGSLVGRLGGYYDQRITQRLILQPRVELNLAAQDVPENRIGAGLSNAEMGLRLRYEITRQFAPYVGISWDRKVGATARYARSDGEDPTNAGLVAGIKFWF